MVQLKPVSRITIGEQVARQLVDMISLGKWKPGEKLPSEAQLCRTLHVGRSTLREALRSLAFMGLVRVRPGEGTRVVSDSSEYVGRILTNSLLTAQKEIDDLCEARLVVEGELVMLCAERATDDDLQKLDRLAAEMERGTHVPKSEFAELDLKFHLTIASGSKNQVLCQLLRTIRGLLQEWIIKSQELSLSQEIANSGHSEILLALKAHSPENAKKAMQNHLHSSFGLLRRVVESEIVA